MPHWIDNKAKISKQPDQPQYADMTLEELQRVAQNRGLDDTGDKTKLASRFVLEDVRVFEVEYARLRANGANQVDGLGPQYKLKIDTEGRLSRGSDVRFYEDRPMKQLKVIAKQRGVNSKATEKSTLVQRLREADEKALEEEEVEEAAQSAQAPTSQIQIEDTIGPQLSINKTTAAQPGLAPEQQSVEIQTTATEDFLIEEATAPTALAYTTTSMPLQTPPKVRSVLVQAAADKKSPNEQATVPKPSKKTSDALRAIPPIPPYNPMKNDPMERYHSFTRKNLQEFCLHHNLNDGGQRVDLILRLEEIGFMPPPTSKSAIKRSLMPATRTTTPPDPVPSIKTLDISNMWHQGHYQTAASAQRPPTPTLEAPQMHNASHNRDDNDNFNDNTNQAMWGLGSDLDVEAVSRNSTPTELVAMSTNRSLQRYDSNPPPKVHICSGFSNIPAAVTDRLPADPYANNEDRVKAMVHSPTFSEQGFDLTATRPLRPDSLSQTINLHNDTAELTEAGSYTMVPKDDAHGKDKLNRRAVGANNAVLRSDITYPGMEIFNTATKALMRRRHHKYGSLLDEHVDSSATIPLGKEIDSNATIPIDADIYATAAIETRSKTPRPQQSVKVSPKNVGVTSSDKNNANALGVARMKSPSAKAKANAVQNNTSAEPSKHGSTTILSTTKMDKDAGREEHALKASSTLRSTPKTKKGSSTANQAPNASTSRYTGNNKQEAIIISDPISSPDSSDDDEPLIAIRERQKEKLKPSTAATESEDPISATKPSVQEDLVPEPWTGVTYTVAEARERRMKARAYEIAKAKIIELGVPFPGSSKSVYQD